MNSQDIEMKTFYILICVILVNAISFSQTKIDSSISISTIDSSIIRQSVLSPKEGIGEITINVSPKDTNKIKIIVIQKTIIHPSLENEGYSSEKINPDTSEMQNAPISIYLSLGDYDMNIYKDNFKPFKGKFAIFKSKGTKVSIDMTSLCYLKDKQGQWRTYKWISAGVSALAGLSTYYFKSRIHTYTDEYNHAASVSTTVDSRNNIISNQNYYRISSSLTFIALGSIFISWIAEDVIYGY